MNIIESNLKWNSSLVYNNVPKKIILHHAEASGCTIYDIDRWHKERGWAGCGYHFYVTKNGSVYSGRPENALGSHCLGYNTNSLGICAEGMYETETMPDVQKGAIVTLIQYLCSKYSINNIYKHKDLNNTSCPGAKYPFNDILTSVKGQINEEPSSKVDSGYGRTWLQVGDSGEKVKELQGKLNKLNYICSIDGIYGKETKNQVYKFQSDSGITADGLAGETTFNTIENKIKSISNICEPEKSGETLHLQRVLNCLGFTGANGMALLEDDIFGSNTIFALKKLQEVLGLKVDGIAGSETWTSINHIFSKVTCRLTINEPIAIRYIQWRLGITPIDGIFGKITDRAVRNWQSSNGLEVDGIFGYNSWTKLIG